MLGLGPDTISAKLQACTLLGSDDVAKQQRLPERSLGDCQASPAGSSPQAPAAAQPPAAPAAGAGGQLLLYIDAMNYASDEFFKGATHLQAVQGAPRRIRRFVLAARAAGWEVVAFIDAAIKSAEAETKWRTRRAREVQKGYRNVPQGMSEIMGQAFVRCGVEVRHSLEADNDDTLAAHAELDGAAVLSGDRDFFRYNGSTFQLFNSFTISSGGRLQLNTHPGQLGNRTKRRDLLLSPRPQTMTTAALGWRVQQQSDAPPLYLRGAPSPLVRAHGVNPHAAVRRLRQALYARTGVAASVREEFPEWDATSEAVVWSTQDVVPDGELDALLDTPQAAYDHMFPPGCPLLCRPPGCSDTDWADHLYALHALVFELCCMASGGKLLLLDLVLALPPGIDARGGQRSRPRGAPRAGQQQVPEAPAHVFSCVGCSASVAMTAKEVAWFVGKQLTLPRRCLACRQLRK